MSTGATQTGPTVDELIARGEIGGRTAIIDAAGDVGCATYEPAPLPAGWVRVRTVRSALSPGTEMTLVGRDASNPYVHKRWNAELRIFEPGGTSLSRPVTFGYRAAGEVVESRDPAVVTGTRVFGNWRHTELVAMEGSQAAEQRLPDDRSWDDGVDIAQMGPICVNAVAFGEGEQRGAPAVVFGAGPVGLLTAQVVRASGAAPVHVVDRLPARLEIAAGLGLEPVEASSGADVAATLKRRYGADGIPVAWECSGSAAALNEAIRTVRRLGLVVAVGFYQGGAGALSLGDEFHHNGIRIICGQIGNPHPSFDRSSLRERTLELVASGALRPGELPRLTLPIERVADGFAALRRPETVLQVALSYDTSGTGPDRPPRTERQDSSH